MNTERIPPQIVGVTSATLWEGKIHRHAMVGSTMDEARTLAVHGARHGTVVIAGAQNAGRGRSGRTWLSPPGNLYMTLVLRPPPEPRLAPQLAFVTAIAVAEATDRLAGPGSRIKWPNDILRDGAKLAGLLMERLEDGAVLAGIGMNVEHAPNGMPYLVTSLRALGSAASVDRASVTVLEALRTAWALWCDRGFGTVLDCWRERGPDVGAGVVVRAGDSTLSGTFAGLRADGAFLLDTAAGRRAVVAGEVQPCTITPDVAKTPEC